MSLKAKLLSASGGAVDKLYVDDVFSAYTYTGNGSTQTINNGIDLAGKGGLVWIKKRDLVVEHFLYDTSRGATKSLSTNDATSEYTSATTLTGFNSSGFSLSTSNFVNGTVSGSSYVSWTFRKAPKFFDVVTYTGNGVAGRQISHSLGVAPGMIIIKCTSTGGGGYEWIVVHKDKWTSGYMFLNSTSANGGGQVVTGDTSTFTLGINWTPINQSGQTYVAYLFAHDSSADGIIQCGSLTIDASYVGAATLGWEPQFILVKAASAGSVDDWQIVDTARGFSNSSQDVNLKPNSNGVESTTAMGEPNATGFRLVLGNAPIGANIIYLAIRRPNKPPTLGTQVYNAIARTGTGAAATVTGVGFAPDLAFVNQRESGQNKIATDRLRFTTSFTNNTNAENTSTAYVSAWGMDGFSVGTGGAINTTGNTYINHFFRRAPGVMDIVCYTGTGVAKTEAHGLGVVPGMVICKTRTQADDWYVEVYPSTLLALNGNYADLGSVLASPTSTGINVGGGQYNSVGNRFVLYLFATKAGISKVFSYTGDGTQGKLIDCGFTTGARFILIKRTDSTGDWFVYDTARTYPAGNDPHLSLNTTAAEVTTTDDVDYDGAGFLVNQNATTNLNITSATYIGLAYS